MRYRIILPKSVQKELDRLSDEVVKRILARLAGLETNPRPGDVKKLKGRNAWRIRVGDYRVIYEIHDPNCKSSSSRWDIAAKSIADLSDVISRKLSVPNAERIFFIRHALRAGFTIEEIFNLTKIDRWFLVQIKEIVDFEEELAGATN